MDDDEAKVDLDLDDNSLDRRETSFLSREFLRPRLELELDLPTFSLLPTTASVLGDLDSRGDLLIGDKEVSDFRGLLSLSSEVLLFKLALLKDLVF